MKESIGSTVMLYVFLILFVIIISIMSITMNFAITFQRKNQVISILERSDGNASIYERDLDNLFKNSSKGWTMVNTLSNKYNGYKCEIAKKNVNNENNKGEYYQVVVFVQFSVPIVNKAFYFPINGETATLAIENTTSVDEPTVNYGN